MNTEKITNQLNKKMNELVKSDSSDFLEDINVGLEFELIFNFIDFQKKNEGKKNKEESNNDSGYTLEDFQNKVYNKLTSNGNKINLNIIDKVLDNEYFDDLRTEENFNNNLDNYQIQILNNIGTVDRDKYNEIFKTIISNFTYELFNGECGFTFEFNNNNQAEVYYTTLDGNKIKVIFKNRNEIITSFAETYQEELFSKYNYKEVSIKDVGLKTHDIFIGRMEENIKSFSLRKEGIFFYKTPLILNDITLRGLTPDSTENYKKRISYYTEAQLKLMMFVNNVLCSDDKLNNELKELNGSNQSSSEIGLKILNYITYNLPEGGVLFDRKTVEDFKVKFFQSLFDSFNISEFNSISINQDELYFSEFFDKLNRVLLFIQFKEIGQYKAQIQQLASYDFQEIVDNIEKFKNVQEIIGKKLNIKQDFLSDDRIEQRIKNLEEDELLEYGQRLFNEKLEQEYDDYNIIKGSNVVFNKDEAHHGLLNNPQTVKEEERYKYLIYERDVSIENFDTKTETGFEMVTPLLKYKDQKKLFNYLIEHKDDYQIHVNSDTGLHLNVSSNNFDILKNKAGTSTVDFVTLQYLLDELQIQLKLRLPSLYEQLNNLDVMGTDENNEKNEQGQEIKYFMWLYQMNGGTNFKTTVDKDKIQKINKQLKSVEGLNLDLIQKNEKFIENNMSKVTQSMEEQKEAYSNFKSQLNKYNEEEDKSVYSNKFADVPGVSSYYKKVFYLRKSHSILIDVLKFIHNNLPTEEKEKIIKQISTVQEDKTERNYLYYVQILLMYLDLGQDNQKQNDYFNKKVNEYIKYKEITRSYNKYFNYGTDNLTFSNLILPEYEARIYEHLDTKQVDLNDQNFEELYEKFNELMYPIVNEKKHQFTIKENRIEFRIIGNEYLEKSVVFYFDHIIKCFYQITEDGIKEELSQLTKEKIRNEIEDMRTQKSQEDDITKLLDSEKGEQ